MQSKIAVSRVGAAIIIIIIIIVIIIVLIIVLIILIYISLQIPRMCGLITHNEWKPLSVTCVNICCIYVR